MPSKPANQEYTCSRKRKAPIDDNGQPVTLPAKKTLGPLARGMKKQKKDNTSRNSTNAAGPATGPSLPQKPLPTSNLSTTKSKVSSRSSSIEDVFDEEDHPHSLPPRNPHHILELEAGDLDESHHAAIDVDDDGEQEDAEAELGLFSISL